MLELKVTLLATMYQLTSASLVASPLALVYGQRLEPFLALKCRQCGQGGLPSLTSLLLAYKANSA